LQAPRIGITTYGMDEQGSYTLPAEYVAATRRAGGIPLLIPPGEMQYEVLCEQLDAVILAGGGDIDPAMYGGKEHSSIYMVDAERDRMELAITQRLLDMKLPMLAICRGAQMVNIALGGTLHEHLPEVFGEEIQHRLPPREPTSHRVTVTSDSALCRLLGESEFKSASWHHQSMNKIGDQLCVVASASDGVVEALEMPGHPWLFAVQWHPEITAAHDPIQQRLFDELVKAANRKS
jgi:putative glutamine amidotransferase